MRLPRRRISDAENKLRVLFCVDALKAATLDQLWPFVAKLELMDYLRMCVCVDELRQDGSLEAGKDALKNVLFLTGRGSETLRLFDARMPGNDRERIRAAAPAYLRELDERRQLSAAYERSRDGEYRVLCAYREGDVPTLILRIVTADRELAKRAVGGFERSASAMLLALYAVQGIAPAKPLACYEELDAAMAAAKPGEPTLCAYGKHEHSAVTWLADESAQYEAALLLPSAEAASRWACAADAAGERLAKALTAALMGATAHE